MSLNPSATIGDTTIQNFNPRFAAAASKGLLRAAKAMRKQLADQTDPTLALATVERLHNDALVPVQQLQRAADQTTSDLQMASDVLAGNIEPDPTHDSAIVRTASDLATMRQQVTAAIPDWDDTGLRSLGDDLADAANSFGEVTIACQRRLEMTIQECQYATAETVAKTDSDLNALSRFDLPPTMRDIDRDMDLGNHQVTPTRATVKNRKIVQVPNPDFVDEDAEYRKAIRLALTAERNGKIASTNRAKTAQKQRTKAEIQSRLKKVWQNA